MNATIYFTIMPSPVGRLILTSDGRALTGVLFDSDPDPGWVRADADAALRAAREQLDQYFAGRRTTFDLPLALRGTPFQTRVWRALLRIPFGATASYGDVARAIGAPNASRAVGGANHRNPLAIVVPCHRVIGADGSLTGYGGGESRKRRLLELERRAQPSAAAPL